MPLASYAVDVPSCASVPQTGEDDYLLKIAVRNRQDLGRFIVERLTPLPGIARVQTSLVLRELEAITALPLASTPPGGPR